MNNQSNLEEILCCCPLCNSDNDVIEQSVELDDEIVNSEIEFPNISTYWTILTCLSCNVSWSYPSWTGDLEDKEDDNG